VLARIPIRLRLALAFALAMAVVLVATGVFLYLRLGSALDESIDESLRTRTADVAGLVVQGGPGSAEGRLAGGDESAAQVLDAEGRIVAATPQLGGEPLLEPDELEVGRLLLAWDDGTGPELVALACGRPTESAP